MKNLALFLFFFGNLIYAQKEFPKINLKKLNSENIISTDFNEANKLYVFAFWATWCAPCIQELDAINDVYSDWSKELKIEIIAVSVDDSRTSGRVKPLVNGKGWDFTILLDSNQDLKRALSIANVPYLIVVKNNKIIFTQNGHSPGAENQLYEKLKEF